MLKTFCLLLGVIIVSGRFLFRLLPSTLSRIDFHKLVSSLALAFHVRDAFLCTQNEQNYHALFGYMSDICRQV